MTEATLNQSGQDKLLARRFLLALCCYFGLHIVLRVVLSGSLDYDEAEQAFLSQWLLPGYTEQPPLYTWLQHGLFAIFGEGVFAVSLLKNGLLLLTYLFVFLSSRLVLKDSRRAIIATLSLLLIPQIGWESQRDMTHTTLVVMAASATFWQSLRLCRNRSIQNYMLFGLFLGIGILAKANIFLFLTVFTLSLATNRQTRHILFTPKMLLSLLLALAMSGDYLFWMLHNQDIVFSASHKFKRAIDHYYIKGLLSLVANSFLFLTPLWAIYLFLFPRGYLLRLTAKDDQFQRLVRRYMFILILTLVIVVLAFKVTYVKDRWLQPLLFLAPLFFAVHVPADSISSRRFRYFLRLSAVCALVIYTTFTLRVVGASYTGQFCRMNYPFDDIAETLRLDGFPGGLIVSDNRFVAGNLRLHFPGTVALIPEYRFEDHVRLPQATQGIVVWQATYSAQPPQLLHGYIQKLYGIDIAGSPVRIIEKPQKFSRGETVKLGVISFSLPSSSR